VRITIKSLDWWKLTAAWNGTSEIESVGLVYLVECLDNNHDKMPKS